MGKGKNKKKGKERLDKFYRLAKDQGYRSRAAFKLIQLNKKFNFLGTANVCIDLCAAPGSWLQVASKFMPISKKIIGVDLDAIKKIPNVDTFVGDITTQECRNEIKRLLGEYRADIVLHDGAPNMGTAWVQDAYTQADLVLSALKLAKEFLNKGGWFVTKVFRSQDYNNLLWVFHKLFKKVTATKPTASRNVSAEIFVVCEDFIAPKKLDPRLLDPKWVFKELELQEKLPDIFRKVKKHKKPNRQGYDTDSQLLFKKISVQKFVEADNPIEILARYNEISFSPCDPTDEEKLLKMYENHPATNIEIKSCLQDLKVLNARDFKGLLKWREKMIKFIKTVTQDNEDSDDGDDDNDDGTEAIVGEEAEKNLTLDEQENLLHLDIEDKLKKIERKRKKKLKKKEKLKEKFRLRTGLGGYVVDDEFEAPTESGLFSLSTIKSTDQLDNVVNNAETDIVLPDEDSDEKLKDDESSDADGTKYDMKNEQHFDLLHQKYLEMSAKYRTGIKLRNRGRDNSIREDMPQELNDYSKFLEMNDDDWYSDEEDDGIENPNELLVKPSEETSKARKVDIWFDEDFDEDLDDDDEDLKKIDQKIKQVQKRKREEVDDGHEAKKRKVMGPEPKPKDWVDTENDEEKMEDASDDYEEQHIKNQMMEDANMEEVPMDDFGEDYDSEDQAELLAMGEMALNPKGRKHLLEKSVNKYAFDDSGSDLPRWFLDDESQHNKPMTPVTKEQVQEWKEHLKALDARNTKKVAEAKGRKHKKVMEEVKKARERAKNITSNSELTDREKIKQIQKIYKGNLANTKPNKVYLVARAKNTKANIPNSNVRIKLVDPRMKKDKRGKKAAERRNKVKRRR